MLKRFTLSTILLLAILALAACQTGGPTAAPIEPSDPQLTDVAGTIAAQLTDAAEANPTARPTNTQPPPATDTPVVSEPVEAEPPTDTPVFVLPTSQTPAEAPEAPVPESPATSTITATLPVLASATPIPATTGEPTDAGQTPTVGDPNVGGGRIITSTLPALTATAAAPPATAGPTDDFLIMYEDDFSSPVFWPVEREETWSLRFAQGGYVVTSDFSGDFTWGVKSDSYSDVRVEVDASRLAGPSSSYFGVICRHQNGSNYYALMIASDGTYGIAKKSAGRLEWLVQSDMQSPAILGGTETNRIRADCIGNTLSLYVNNQFVASADDSEFVSGAVGVGAGNRYQDGIEAVFDNIVISVPQ